MSAPARPRVLLVTHYFPEHRSGVEIIAGEVAQRLAQHGVRLTWAASEPAVGPEVLNIARLPMRTWNVTEERLGVPYPLWSPASLLLLARAVHACDVVHLHDCLYFGNVFAYLCARWLGKPVVVTQHIGLVPYASRLLRGLMGWANRLLGGLVLGGCTRCIYYSPKVLEYFRRFVRFRTAPAFIPNGVDPMFRPLSPEARAALRHRLDWPLDRPVLLFVGRFVEKKGLPLLRRLAEQFPQCEWVFVGWGPLTPTDWGLPQVRCLGPLPQAAIVPCYQAADCLVLPSFGEGFPLVVQEALACGTPALISTDTAQGCPEIETVAWVSDLSWESLQQEVAALVTNATELERRRLAVAAFARRWNWDECVTQYEQVLAEATRR